MKKSLFIILFSINAMCGFTSKECNKIAAVMTILAETPPEDREDKIEEIASEMKVTTKSLITILKKFTRGSTFIIEEHDDDYEFNYWSKLENGELGDHLKFMWENKFFFLFVSLVIYAVREARSIESILSSSKEAELDRRIKKLENRHSREAATITALEQYNDLMARDTAILGSTAAIVRSYNNNALSDLQSIEPFEKDLLEIARTMSGYLNEIPAQQELDVSGHWFSQLLQSATNNRKQKKRAKKNRKRQQGWDVAAGILSDDEAN